MLPIKSNITNRPSRSNKRLFRLALSAAGGLGSLLSGCMVQGQPLVLNPKGPAVAPVAYLSWWVWGIAAVILAAVTVSLLIAVFRRHPDDSDNKMDQALPGDRRILRWGVIGISILAIALIIAAALSFSAGQAAAANESSTTGKLTIQVIGHQWWWEVRYPAEGFATANEIHIPVGQPVTLKLTSADVVHGFWVPQLHPELDMLPGQTTLMTLQADQPGTYQGECVEYCGVQHAHMDFIVVAQSQGDYSQWVAQQKRPAPAPAVNSIEKKGEQAFLGSSCVYCHTIQGTNASGTLGPDLTHLASRATIGAGARPNTLANLAGWVVNSQVIKPGNKMPPINLDPDQLQAIMAYLETLK